MHGSECILLYPRSSSLILSSIFHSCLDCLSPYNVLSNWHALLLPSLYPSGCIMNISSLRLPFKYAPLTSICCISQSSTAAKANNTLIVSRHMTGENTSRKSNPGIWEYPFATNQALYLVNIPCFSYFCTKTHLFLIMLH